MNTRFHHRRAEQGGVLPATLLIVLLLGVALASYLVLVRQQRMAVARSLCWNNALTLAEAGVEEALAHMNSRGDLIRNIPNGNGWTLSAGMFEQDAGDRELGGGRYAVAIVNLPSPVIYSTGYVTVPITADVVSRVLVVRTTNAPLFTGGLMAGRIERRGSHELATDTYDSDSSRYSSSGHYDSRRAKTALTTNVTTSALEQLPELFAPFSTGLPMPPRRGNTYRLSGNILVQGDLNIGSGERLLVNPSRSVVLYVRGNFTMHPNATIEIGTAASLKIFTDGGTATFGKTDNDNAPDALSFYGLPGNTNIVLASSDTKFVGTLFAPDAALTAVNSTNRIDFEGSATVGSLIVNRPLRFHFDEALLQSTSPRRGYIVTSWSEM